MGKVLGIAAALLVSAVSQPTRAEAPLEAYGRLPNIDHSQFKLSPNGDRFAFVASTAKGRQLFVSDVRGQVLMTLPTGAAKVRDLEWVGDDHFLLTTTATVDTWAVFKEDKSELSQVVIGNLRQKTFKIALSGDKYLLPIVYGNYGVAELNGHAYAYLSTITMEGSGSAHIDVSRPSEIQITHGWTDLYRVDLDTGDAHKVAGGSPRMSGWAIAGDGSVAGHAEYEQQTGAWRLYADPEDRRLLYKTINPHSPDDFGTLTAKFGK